MIISDLSKIEGRRFPARRHTRNLVGGAAPIQATAFSLGNVVLDPNGGQVPWHNQEQEEVYFIVEGTGEMCLGEERQTDTTGQAVYIPSGVFHQLTNIGDTP
ncbi:MAG: dimethylsulfonioproprionate lyase family protein, partial [Chthoniobacteraceae bacterium]